jgi:N-acetylglutamate synthase-like GNAT family acetyltransferase
MRYGPRTNDGASLKLAVPTALPLKMRGKVVEVRGLRTMPDKRGQGHASDLMLSVCVEADIARTFLFLAVEPDDDGPLDAKALCQFYMKFGFLPIQSDPPLMTRPFVGALARQPA